MKRSVLFYLTLLIGTSTPLSAEVTVEGDLPRKAALGFSTTAQDDLLLVRSVDAGSPAQAAGLLADDRLVAINQHTIELPHIGEGLLEDADGGQSLRLSVVRDDQSLSIHFTPDTAALEAIPGMDSHYGVVEMNDGARLRTIISRPSGSQGPSPALFFVQWVSCGSLEYNPNSTSRQLLIETTRLANRTLVRVERASNGDSQGPRCHELDYDTELAHYVQAFRQLLHSPHIDLDDVVLMGSSLGSTLAPLIASRLQSEGVQWAGLAIQGGGAVSYLERMLNFERIYLERSEKFQPDEIQSQFYQRLRFYSAYFLEGRSPDDIANDNEQMAAVRSDIRGLGNGQHYGRPYAWHQQAAKHDFLAAWAQIDSPVLVIFNEYDQFETRHGHRLIADTVNRLRPGTATYVEFENIGHSNFFYADTRAAYANRGGTPVPMIAAAQYAMWMRALNP